MTHFGPVALLASYGAQRAAQLALTWIKTSPSLTAAGFKWREGNADAPSANSPFGVGIPFIGLPIVVLRCEMQRAVG
jgi:hypothetical protein